LELELKKKELELNDRNWNLVKGIGIEWKVTGIAIGIPFCIWKGIGIGIEEKELTTCLIIMQS
jgi:hypothetical protein